MGNFGELSGPFKSDGSQALREEKYSR